MIGDLRPIIVPFGSEIAFVLSCASLVLAFVALFLRFATRRHAALDSLSESSYGIYIVHYVIVTWLQFGLLDLSLPVPLKVGTSFVGATVVSWAIVALLRRRSAVASII
jgi:surface polysaccharide O-acyltransferase-like enzyme